MKHASKHITAYHYIVNFDTLGINNRTPLNPIDILKNAGQQKNILDFC